MKRTSILAPFIIFQSIFRCLLPATAMAQPLTSRSVTASAYIERGATWFVKGEYERALADFDLAIASDPGHAESYYNRATARCYLQDVEPCQIAPAAHFQLDRLPNLFAAHEIYSPFSKRLFPSISAPRKLPPETCYSSKHRKFG
jgi:tetratricopeptide (TPR) repeat protein